MSKMKNGPKALPKVIFGKWENEGEGDNEYFETDGGDGIDRLVETEEKLVGEYVLKAVHKTKLVVTSEVVTEKVK